MAVYLIQCGPNGPVKIGKADDPKGRLSELQVAHWQTLTLVRVWEGSEADERALHARFADLRIRGEWFHFSRQMLGDVGLPIVEEPPPPASPPAPSRPWPIKVADFKQLGATVRALRTCANMTQEELAEKVGSSRSTIASIEAGHDLPGRDLTSRISLFFGVSLFMEAA